MKSTLPSIELGTCWKVTSNADDVIYFIKVDKVKIMVVNSTGRKTKRTGIIGPYMHCGYSISTPMTGWFSQEDWIWTRLSRGQYECLAGFAE